MNATLNYIVEANLGLLFILASYLVFLRKETSFTLLRVFLLSGIAVALVFPLIHIQVETLAPLSISQVVPSYWLPEVVVGGAPTTAATAPAISFWKVISFVYLAGLGVGVLLLTFQLGELLLLIVRSRTYRWHNLSIAEFKGDKPTFSFFRFIFIGNAHQLSAHDKEQIIRHESVHASRWHSLDILLLNALKIVFWFNPFIKTYKKIFIQLHEFEADSRAVENSDLNKYCSLLAKVALKSAGFTLANHFNNSLTVKRIEMMKAIKNKIRPWKMVLVTLVVTLSFYLIACHDQVGSSAEGSQEKEKVFTVVEQMPEFEGGYEKFAEHLQSNITYPSTAKEAGIGGTVHVEFVVSKDGSLSDFKVIKSVEPALDAEALRVIRDLPPWKPGTQNGRPVNVRFVIPISFNPDFSSTTPEQLQAAPEHMQITVEKLTAGGKTIVNGVVRDKETGDPLPGTNVLILGTTKGVTTDLNGRFQLEVQGNGELVASFVGYESQRVGY
ncbi:MAG TPA: TonB family protein [Chryseosolibacter sp.]|nr:TonB family protein [Chryseosolibacter sp.]